MSILDVSNVSPPETADRRVHMLHRYWTERRGRRRFPARRDIDPVDLPLLLTNLSLVEIRAEAPRFVYRVSGGELGRMLKRELTGLPVGTGVKDSELEHVFARYERVAQDGVALFHRDRLQETANDFTEIERLMVPLGESDDRVNMILSIVVPVSKPAAIRAPNHLFP
jgi:hypothetical protein